MPLRKDTLMAQNLLLLGFVASAPGSGTSHEAAQAVVLSMFDRPNEKLLFSTLHFLLLRLQPAIAQELRYCWPITTPQDKTAFKKLVQSLLVELEKQQLLPPGSSQASRINTGCGPRVVDLVWRLSTLAIKAALERDFTTKKRTPLPSFEHVPTADALVAVKTRIAMKTHALKRKSVQRCRVQDEWIAFASTLTDRIQELNALQKRVHDEQNALDASTGRRLHSLVDESRRVTALENLEAAWSVLDDVLDGPTYAKSQRVLSTVAQYDAAPPVLAAAAIRPLQSAVGGRSDTVDLSDVVRATETLLNSVRRCVQGSELDALDQPEAASVLESSHRHAASLRSMVLQLQHTVAQITESNDVAAQSRYIRRTAGSDESVAGGRPVGLCPLTPAQQLQHEHRLVQSLEKVSMGELTALTSESMRRSNQQKKSRLDDTNRDDDVDDSDVIRKLQYSDADERMEP
jgi:hypothetical protein